MSPLGVLCRRLRRCNNPRHLEAKAAHQKSVRNPKRIPLKNPSQTVSFSVIHHPDQEGFPYYIFLLIPLFGNYGMGDGGLGNVNRECVATAVAHLLAGI